MQDFGRVKVFIVPPPTPGKPEGPICLLVQPDTGSIPDQGVRTRDLPGKQGAEISPPSLVDVRAISM